MKLFNTFIASIVLVPMVWVLFTESERGFGCFLAGVTFTLMAVFVYSQNQKLH